MIGAEDSWRPLSISPPLTLAALLVLVPAVGTTWAVSTLSRRDRRFLLLVIAVVGLCGALLGAVQLVGGPDAFRLYEKSNRGWLTAFHANRNAAADVLLIASLALGAWFASQRDESRRKRISPIIVITQIVLLIAVLLTRSRAGIAIFLRDQLDDVVHTPEDVEDKLGLSLLGVMPRAENGTPVEVLADPKSSLTEAYNSMRGALLYSTPRAWLRCWSSPARNRPRARARPAMRWPTVLLAKASLRC